MFEVRVEADFAAAHFLKDYNGKCENLHGHNWIITVFCKAEKLNEDSMVMDFKHLKQKIHGCLDHGNLNELLPFNPTAENIAKWVTEQFPECYKAKVQESEGNIAVYCVDKMIDGKEAL